MCASYMGELTVWIVFPAVAICMYVCIIILSYSYSKYAWTNIVMHNFVQLYVHSFYMREITGFTNGSMQLDM